MRHSYREVQFRNCGKLETLLSHSLKADRFIFHCKRCGGKKNDKSAWIYSDTVNALFTFEKVNSVKTNWIHATDVMYKFLVLFLYIKQNNFLFQYKPHTWIRKISVSFGTGTYKHTNAHTHTSTGSGRSETNKPHSGQTQLPFYIYTD